MLKISLCAAIVCIGLIAQASGYATNVAFLDCSSNWDKKQVTVWIENSQDGKYTGYVTEAFNAWQEAFPKLQYSIYTDEPKRWDILVKIMDKYTDEKDADVLATTEFFSICSSSSLERVSITIPVHMTNGGTEQEYVEINDTMFYNLVLHEIGHAIGLGHANENKAGAIDPMYKYINEGEEKRLVSNLDIKTLERLYR